MLDEALVFGPADFMASVGIGHSCSPTPSTSRSRISRNGCSSGNLRAVGRRLFFVLLIPEREIPGLRTSRRAGYRHRRGGITGATRPGRDRGGDVRQAAPGGDHLDRGRGRECLPAARRSAGGPRAPPRPPPGPPPPPPRAARPTLPRPSAALTDEPPCDYRDVVQLSGRGRCAVRWTI